MELSNVLNKLTGQKAPENEYFWALQLWDSGLKCAIWTIIEGKVKVVSLGSHELWQETTDDLVAAADRSLACASERFLEEGPEPSKVIFGLPYGWLEGEKILPAYQERLQTICEKLDLAPVGFVLTVDALNHHLKDTEGIPPSAVLVSPQKNQVLVAVLEYGKVENVEQIVRSENLGADVYEGLARFKEKETLPARILLFDGEDMESTRQVLIDFPWQQKLPFLHFPKVEILPVDFDISSICLAGGSEVAKSLGFKVVKEEKTEEMVETEEVVDRPAELASVEADETEEVGETAEILEEDFGFVQGKDVAEKIPAQATAKEEELLEVDGGGEAIPQDSEPIEKKRRFNLLAILPRFKIPHLKLIPLPSFPLFSVFGLILLIVILLLAGGFLFLWYVPRADVVMSISSKTIEKELDLTIDPNQEVLDENNLILPGEIIDQEVSGEKSEATSGQKTVGEKAKGEVTIFNTSTARNLASGTIFTGPGGLKFALDQEVNIASGSAVNREEMKAQITAFEIGADYNLAGDSLFSIGNLDKSIIGAKNDTALSGGTSRQIQAVSEADQKNLIDSLTQTLTDKAKAQLLENVPSGRKMIEESLSSKEVARSFSNKVGEEAQSLSLNLKIKASVLVFSEDELLNLVQKQTSDVIPEGYELKKEALQTEFIIKKQEKDGSVQFSAKVRADLVPKFQIDEVIKNIKGKSPQVAREYLLRLPGVNDVVIEIKPSLPSALLSLPRQEKKISLELRRQ